MRASCLRGPFGWGAAFGWAFGAAAFALAGGAACGSSSGGFNGSPGTEVPGNDAGTLPTNSSTSSGASSSSSGGSTVSASSGGSSGGVSSIAPDASSDAQGATDAASGSSGGQDSGLVPDPDGGTCPAPAGITTQQQTALQIINQTRAAMGSPCDTMVPALNTSASKHCQYYAANLSNMNCISNPHVEVSGCTDYVAAQFYDRETAAGYSCMPSATNECNSSEVMAEDDNPTLAIAQWIGSIYHRSPLLDPWIRDFGYGNATMCDTIDLGEGAGSTTPADVVVSYPYDGMTGVGLSFDGALEEPTPPVPPNGWPSGMPIHVFMQASSITLTTDEFGVEGGAQVAHQVLTPQASQGYLSDAVVLYGNVPLTSNTTYRVHVAGTRQNQTFNGTTSGSFDVSFSFTTQ
jgi:uncharacterized protein YkwD